MNKMKNKAYVFLISLLTVACQSNYYSMNDYKSIPKIDSHVHIDSDKGLFEKQAAKDNFILLTLMVDHSDSLAVTQQLSSAINSASKFPGKVFYGATFYFDTLSWGTDAWSRKAIAQLDHNIDSGGAVTVKLWKNIGMTERDKDGKFIMIDDPRIKPVIDFIVSKNIPVTGHLGEPKNCWLPLSEMTVTGDSSYYAENPKYHMFLHPEYPTYDQQIDARDHLLELHPELKFIGCHLGSLEWNVDELAKRLDKFPNMSVDMAARICHLQYQSAKDRKKVRDFIIKYQDRLLYGTDLSDNDNSDSTKLTEWEHATWIDDWKYFATADKMVADKFRGTFEGLQLPKEVVRKIYYDNAITWYNLKLN
jgi:predicted TIM-barrel fold metal-dependent hydrolase